jgi:hypothetical protein
MNISQLTSFMTSHLQGNVAPQWAQWAAQAVARARQDAAHLMVLASHTQ